jgi:hypothetical protein
MGMQFLGERPEWPPEVQTQVTEWMAMIAARIAQYDHNFLQGNPVALIGETDLTDVTLVATFQLTRSRGRKPRIATIRKN